jgi:hypothetical protein
MDLGGTGVRKQSASFVIPPSRRHIATLGVGRKVEHVAVAAGRKNDRVCCMAGDFACDQVPNHDAFGVSIDQNQVEHFGPGKHFYRTGCDLVFERLISSKQQLLTGLPPGIKGSGNLNPAEGTVCEQTAILARKGDSLRHALVDYIQTDLGQAINIRFSRAKITAFDGVIEQPENRTT